MSAIFISYRRDDSAADMTDRIYERLAQRWGRRVFMDIDSLVGGDLFAKAIEESLENCAVMIVVLGRHWFSLTDDKGARRVENPDDFPRMEVAAALRRGIRVIPVLVGNAQWPKPAEVPSDIAALLDRQAVRVSRERFNADIRELINAVAFDMPGESWRRPSRLFLGSAALVILLSTAVALYFASNDVPPPAQLPPQPSALPSRPTGAEERTPEAVAPPASSVVSPNVEAAPATNTPVEAVPRASDVSAKGRDGSGGVVAKGGNVTAGSKLPAPSTGKDINARRLAPLTGNWLSTPIVSAYSSFDRFTLQFEFVQQGDAVLGTVSKISADTGNRYSSAIVDGKLKDDVVSFHTEHETTGRNDTYVPYKQIYVGTIVQGKKQIDFRRYNTVSTGGRTETFVAAPKP